VSNSKIKIFDADELHSDGVNLLKRRGFEVIELCGLGNDELISSISKYKPLDTDISAHSGSALCIRSFRKITANHIKKISETTDIKLICTASSGFDNVDIAACRLHKIKVTNVPGATFIPAAEHTIAMILSVTKNLIPADRDMKNGVFEFKRYSNTELFEKTIGIIGLGKVGSHVGKIARSFGMVVLGNDIDKSLAIKYKWIKFLSLKALLSKSDFVTVHTPLDKTTRNLINEKNIALLKKGAILVNCARGGIINENALIDSLKDKKLSYACIDVFTDEPKVNDELLKLENVVLTPHLAGKTKESKQRVSVQLAGIISDYYDWKRKVIKTASARRM